jgi:hypothetical protein
LGPKGVYPGREKPDLEGMTWTLTMIGAIEGALSGVAGRIKNLVTESLKVTLSIGVYTCSYF